MNRGVAVADGKVFVATANGYLVALDATTGTPVWQQAFVDPRAGESATMAPLVVKDKVIVGSSRWGGWMKRFSPELYGSNRGTALVVFTLP